MVCTAVLALAGPAAAQFNGGISSGFNGGISSGFNGGISSGFQSGFGGNSGGSRAQTNDATLGSSGTFGPMLSGQPSNFGPSMQATGPISGSTLTFDNGPATSLDIGAGPAGPLD